MNLFPYIFIWSGLGLVGSFLLLTKSARPERALFVVLFSLPHAIIFGPLFLLINLRHLLATCGRQQMPGMPGIRFIICNKLCVLCVYSFTAETVPPPPLLLIGCKFLGLPFLL